MPSQQEIDIQNDKKQQGDQKQVEQNEEDQKKWGDHNQEELVQQYFKKIKDHVDPEIVSYSQEVYSKKRINNVRKDIAKGEMSINEESRNIANYLNSKRQEQEIIDEKKVKREQISLKLRYLGSQMNPIQGKEVKRKEKSHDHSEPNENINQERGNYELFPHPNILSRKQHRNLIKRLKKDREQRDKNIKIMINNLEEGIVEEQKKEKEQKDRKANEEKEKRRYSIEQSIQKKKQLYQVSLQRQKQAKRHYSQLRKKKFLHQKMEQRYQSEIVVPALQQKKKKLKEIRQIGQAFNLQSIREHEKKYLSNRNQTSGTKSKAQQVWKYKAPERSEKLSRFLEEEKIDQMKKLEQKKRLVDQQKQKKDQFVAYLKKNFEPKIDYRKKEQLEQKIENMKKKDQKVVDIKDIGSRYLEEAKRKKKYVSRVESEKDRSHYDEASSYLKQKSNTNYLEDKRRQDYESIRKKRLSKLLNSEENSAEKIQKLQIQSLKLARDFQRKEELMRYKENDVEIQQQAVEILLTGIKAKMGIINAYKSDKLKQETYQ